MKKKALILCFLILASMFSVWNLIPPAHAVVASYLGAPPANNATRTTVYVNNFDANLTEWTEVGGSPYLNAIEDGHRIWDVGVSPMNNEGYFSHQHVSTSLSITEVWFYMYFKEDQAAGNTVMYVTRLSDDSYIFIGDAGFAANSGDDYRWAAVQLRTFYHNPANLNGMAWKIRLASNGVTCNIDAVALVVHHTSSDAAWWYDSLNYTYPQGSESRVWYEETKQGFISTVTDPVAEGNASLFTRSGFYNKQTLIYQNLNLPVNNTDFWFGGWFRALEVGGTVAGSYSLGIGIWMTNSLYGSVHVQKNGSHFYWVTMEGFNIRGTGTTQYNLNTWYMIDIYVNYTSMQLYVNDVLEIWDNETRQENAPTRFYLTANHPTEDANQNQAYWDYLYLHENKSADDGAFTPIVEGKKGEITNMEGCGNWVFAEARYYKFKATYYQNFEYGNGSAHFHIAELAFVDAASRWINASYDFLTDIFSITAKDINNDTLAYISHNGTINDVGWNTTVTFEIQLTSLIIDTLNASLWIWANATTGTQDSWREIATNYFHIYNDGGLVLRYQTSGTAYRKTGGDIFDLYAENNSQVYTEFVYRNLAHIKMQPEIIARQGQQKFEIIYYVDYCRANDSGFITGWRVHLVGEGGDLTGNKYWNWTVRWYLANTQIKKEIVYTYASGTVGAGNNVSSRIWLDFWFNRLNGSSVIGGRISAYEYPMVDNAPLWLRWLSTNWGVDESLQQTSMFFETLKDANNNTVYASQIKLVRIGVLLLVQSDPLDQKVHITNHIAFDLTFSPTHLPFEGIQTPPFEDPRLPKISAGGWVGSIFSAFGWLADAFGKTVGAGLLGLWNTFVGFLDTIFTFFGWANGFSQILSWITSFLGWLVNAFTWLITALTSGFTFLASFIGKFLNTIAIILTNLVLVVNGIWDMLGGVYTGGVHIWNDLGLATWIIILAIFYPIYLLGLWETKGIDAAINHVRMILDVFSMIAHVFITVIQQSLNMIGRIIESIPVVE